MANPLQPPFQVNQKYGTPESARHGAISEGPHLCSLHPAHCPGQVGVFSSPCSSFPISASPSPLLPLLSPWAPSASLPSLSSLSLSFSLRPSLVLSLFFHYSVSPFSPLPSPPLFHLPPTPPPVEHRARNAAEAVTSPGGSPDPRCPRASFPSSRRPSQPCAERALGMGRGSGFKLWARVAQIKG